MKHSFLLKSSAMLMIFFASCDKSDSNDMEQLNATDRQFLTKASISNSAEVDAATLAVSKATNNAVKNFAQHMISEHTLAQTELKVLGTAVGYPVKDTIDPAHIALKNQLSALAGRQFDSTYTYAQVADHQATVADFQNEISSGADPDVKAYANKYLPHIQMHFQSADSLAKALFPR